MNFPEDKMVLGRSCGTIIDVRTALNTKIMRKNGQQVHSYTYMALTSDILLNRDEIKARDEFDTAIGEKLGPAASAKDFESDPEIVTPTLDKYEDDEEHQNHMPEVDDITPEAM